MTPKNLLKIEHTCKACGEKFMTEPVKAIYGIYCPSCHNDQRADFTQESAYDVIVKMSENYNNFLRKRNYEFSSRNMG